MDRDRLANSLAKLLGPVLSKEIASDYVKTRHDFATQTLERPSAGKLVETFVQCLQHISAGKYDNKPDVDKFLVAVESNTKLDDGLRICAARVARSIYTLRNKRNIAHKNSRVDPNTFDLAFVHRGAAWLVAELLRQAEGTTMEDAGALIELVQAPIGTLVEDIEGKRIVHGQRSTRSEALILLHSHYPNIVPFHEICESMFTRTPKVVGDTLRGLVNKKHALGHIRDGFRLTSVGHDEAAKEIQKEFRGK